jgi:PAS domain S-box-containing protein
MNFARRGFHLKSTFPLIKGMQFGLIGVVAILVVIGIVAYRSLITSTASARSAQHTNEVLEHLANLRSTTEDVERGYRDFALSGNEAYLRRANASIMLAAQERKAVGALTVDNPSQQVRIGTIVNLTELIIRRHDNGLDGVGAPGETETAPDVIRAGQGDPLLGEFRVVARDMENEERRLLALRNADSERRFRQTKVALSFGGASALLIAAVAGWLVPRAYAARQRTLTALLSSEERMRVLIEGVEDYAIFMLDPRGTVVTWNAGAEKIKGYKAREIIGDNFSRFYTQSDVNQGRPQEELRIAAASGRSTSEHLRVRKDGSQFWAKLVITAARDKSAKLLGFSEISHDITEPKNAERLLAATVAELKRSNDELGQFASVASHDLQEPLRMVVSYTQLLATNYRGRLDAEADEFIAFAVDGCNRMQEMIRDLLTYSRAGSEQPALARISSEDTLRDALANLQAAVQESGAIVTHDPLPDIIMDAGQLTQVFQNLIGNAIKYHDAGIPRVHVSALAADGGQWIFSVRDDGLGIDANEFERIFVLFQRLHAREEFTGTGIGLSICKKVLERRGGRIWVESTVGEGSTFRFAVPDIAGVACAVMPG